MTPTEREAEAYADSIDRRRCAFWQGMYRGYIAGHDKARNQAIQDCIDRIQSMHDLTLNKDYKFAYSLSLELMQKLKTKP